MLPAGVVGSNPTLHHWGGEWVWAETHTTSVILGEPGMRKRHSHLDQSKKDWLHAGARASGKLPA
jgi:hypothetical protein